MGIQEDLERFREVGEEKRQDLAEFIKKGNLQAGENIEIPIKIIELPSFEYDKYDMGGVGKGDGDVGDPVDIEEQEGEGDEDEPGEESGEHGHYEMDPEEFAEELDEELGLDLEPKGKQIKEEKEGDYTDVAKTGPDSTLDFDKMFKEGLKRTMAMHVDHAYLRKILQVSGVGPERAYEWANQNGVPIGLSWFESEYESIQNTSKFDSIDDIPGEYRHRPRADDIENVSLRKQDKRHKYPETSYEYEKNAVVVFMRDVSGSMGESKRELVERIFTPLDWYLTGKYDEAEFIYIAHDSEAWQTERNEFFGIESNGGTLISSAYELAQEILEEEYPWSQWNRYVFASGDGENAMQDSEEKVVPLMKEIEANLHAYIEVQPDEYESRFSIGGDHTDIVEERTRGMDNVAVTKVRKKDEVLDAIYDIISQEGENQ